MNDDNKSFDNSDSNEMKDFIEEDICYFGYGFGY